MTVRKMGRVKERVGEEERKETSIPLHTLSFFGSRFIFRSDKAENPVPRPPSVIRELKNHDEVHDDNVCWPGKDWNENFSFGGEEET